jgi:dTDP-4-amino-4,6-dideoxygalactose transaminase
MPSICLEIPPSVRDVQNAICASLAGSSRDTNSECGFRFLGSGKAAIAAVLGFLRHNGTVPSKNSEILVPQWLGIAVYQQMMNQAFPVLSCTDRTKALLVYHQYGFPQDMDRILDFAATNRLTVIEDCAHAVDGFYKGRQLGSFGHYAIYSFSKFTFCFALGGVRFRDNDFSTYLDQAFSRQPSLLRPAINLFKLIDELNLSRNRPLLLSAMTRARIIAYALYGESLQPSIRAIALWKDKERTEKTTRRKYFCYLRERLRDSGMCDHLELDDVAPYAIPVRLPDNKARALVVKLHEEGIRTGIYHFDVNRCLLAPHFVPCVLLPCHSGISETGFDKIAEIALQSIL